MIAHCLCFQFNEVKGGDESIKKERNETTLYLKTAFYPSLEQEEKEHNFLWIIIVYFIQVLNLLHHN